MPAGVTSTGLTIKTIEDIKGEIEDDLLANINPALVLSPDQPLGQINAAHAKKLAELWELAQVAYNGFNRNATDGAQLDNVGDLTGSPRKVATKTRVQCTINLNASQSYTPGQLKANVTGQPTNTFVNESAVASTTAGNYTAWFVSEVYGPQVANAGTLTQITTPVAGWNSITNAADGIVGALAEIDGDYRNRQEEELFRPGSCTVDAIRVDVLRVAGVISAYAYENVTMVTDSAGVPAKAVECIIFDGIVPAASNNTIAQAIWNSKASGAETYGTSFGTATDSDGVARTVYFTRSTIKNVYLEYDIRIDATKFPIDGIQQVKNAAVKTGDTGRKTDDDVIALVLRAAVLSPVVKGVTDVAAMRLGFAASPTGTTNLTITPREIADFDTSRILVNIVA